MDDETCRGLSRFGVLQAVRPARPAKLAARGRSDPVASRTSPDPVVVNLVQSDPIGIS